MAKTLKVGYIQFAPKFGEINENIIQIQKIIKTLPTADLVVLPELCTSGYAFENREEAKKYAEAIPGGRTTRSLEKIAKENNIYIIAGINESDSEALFNSAVFISPQGYRGKYRKNHLFNTEKLIYSPGNLKFPIFNIGKTKVGILICFDWIFPEAWRTLALKGAEIICHPSNLVLENLAHRSIPVTALTNRVFIINANRIGRERDLHFIGGSMIADPQGNILHKSPGDKPDVFVTTIAPHDARDKMITERNDVLGDRRPEIYEL